MRPLFISERITRRETESFRQYLTEVDNIDRLTTDEEYEIAVKAFAGDEEARQELVLKNLRFVISVAKQYDNGNVRLEDLVNEGNYGMIRASHRFDPSQGFKFISYSVWWIRRSILEFLTKDSRTIRIPSNQANNITKLTNKIGIIEQRLERKATKFEIMDEVGEDFNEREINFFLSLDNTNTLSLDNPLGEDGDGDLKSTIESTNFISPDHHTTRDDIKYNANLMLNQLPKAMQKIVLIKIYGLDGGIPKDLKEVANELNITRERVRQIRDKAFRILKSKVATNQLHYMVR